MLNWPSQPWALMSLGVLPASSIRSIWLYLIKVDISIFLPSGELWLYYTQKLKKKKLLNVFDSLTWPLLLDLQKDLPSFLKHGRFCANQTRENTPKLSRVLPTFSTSFLPFSTWQKWEELVGWIRTYLQYIIGNMVGRGPLIINLIYTLYSGI